MYKAIIVIVLGFLFLVSGVSAVEIQPDVIMSTDTGNVNFSVAQTMPFSSIIIGNTWVQFNNTNFSISSANPVDVSLVTLHSNIDTVAVKKTVVLEFNATTTGGTITFNISGFSSDAPYTVYRNDTRLTVVRSDLSGEISFDNNLWSSRNFKIKVGSLEAGNGNGGAPGGDIGEVDTDGDGLSDALEVIIGTNPFLQDTDGDGYTDHEEYMAGTDPLDPNDYPGLTAISGSFLLIPIVFWLFSVIPAIVVFLVIFFYCRKQKEEKRRRCYMILLTALLLLIVVGIFIYSFT